MKIIEIVLLPLESWKSVRNITAATRMLEVREYIVILLLSLEECCDSTTRIRKLEVQVNSLELC